MAPTTAEISSPGLQEATKRSTSVWREHLEQLFHHAKDRFPDVVWAVGDDEDDVGTKVEEVWGHKAIVYARAPPSFQSRYFSIRPQPYASSPTGTLPTTSALSLDMVQPTSRTPSPPIPSASPAPSTTLVGSGPILRLSTSITPALFSNELEYLYTGEGFGEAFEFLFDTPQLNTDAEEMRIDKLRKDLVFMWRSRLYSDVRIALTGNFSTSHENTTAIFSSHRFILVSRSPYFYNALIAWPTAPPSDASEPPPLTLPSPPFTPASLHFTLGFIYTGTLVFSHRSYDLTTAFQILRSATYLSLPTLHDEVQARIVQEMLHGLFHAFLPFQEYERLTGGAWGTGGCRCRQCARRIPRVLEFSLADDVKNGILERGARRALVGLFGEGWCTSEFAGLHIRLREGILRGLAKRTTPPNALPLLFAAEHARGRLAAVIDAWAAEVTEMVLTARKAIDDLICNQSETIFSTREWNEIMDRDGVAFEDAERVEWVMAAVLRGVNERNSATLYQTLVSSILLRPHPTEISAPMLPPTSHIRVQVEQARVDLLKWIAKRWLNIRQEGGFDELEGWALKEISDNIEVPLEDLVRPISHANHQYKPPRPSTLHRARESESTNDTISVHSMRVSVLNRNLISPIMTGSHRGNASAGRRVSPSSTAPSSSASSYKSLPRSGVVSAPRKSQSQPRSQKSVAVHDDPDPPGSSPEQDDSTSTYSYRFTKDNSRPDSKLTPALSSIGLPSYSSPYNQISSTPQLSKSDSEQEGDNDEDDAASEYMDPRQSVNSDTVYADAEDAPSLHSLPISKPHVPSQKPTERSDSPASTSQNTAAGRSPKVVISKVSPSNSSIRRSAAASAASGVSVSPSLRPSPSNASIRSTASVSSVRSHASRNTIKSSGTGNRPISRTSTGTGPGTGPGTRGPSTLSVVSNASVSTNASDEGTGTFHSLNPSTISLGTNRTRRPSAASTVNSRPPSNVNLNLGVTTPRVRKTSTSSVKSVTSITATPTKRRPAVTPLDTGKVGSIKSRSSVASVRSTVTALGRAGGSKKVVSPSPSSAEARAEKHPEPSPASRVKSGIDESGEPEQAADSASEHSANEEEEPDEASKASPTISVPSLHTALEHRKSASTASTASNATLKRKESTDTITTRLSSTTTTSATPSGTTSGSGSSSISEQPSDVTSTNSTKELPELPAPTAPQEDTPTPTLPRGATLDIGIPCIISSKRKRFKAYARYIGEVEGEDGPWVGVEVPMNDSWSSGNNSLDGDDGERQWHDGTWGGIRYFEIRNTGGADSDWEYGDDPRPSRRQRLDWLGGSSVATVVGPGMLGRGKSMLKREGEQLGRDHAAKRIRSVSPAVSDTSGVESRGLFVRPQQVLYVVDAVGSYL